jgi:hypothetical protein
MGRPRPTDSAKTVRRRIDVAAAFAATEGSPLDTIPRLGTPRTEIPWGELGDLATKLLLRVDGTASTGAIGTAMMTLATPKECAREFVALSKRGIVKLVASGNEGESDGGEELEIDIDLSDL